MKSHPILKSYPGLETNTDWHGISERNDLFEIIWNPFTNASWQNAILARCLMMDTILHDYISTLLTCRLVSVKKKDNGIRPVGADECLWRIISKTSKTIKTQNNVISKTITGLLKEDIIHAVGTLQTCAGLESGNSNTCCKENLRKGKQWMLAVSGCRQCIQQTQQKSQSRKHQKSISPMYTYLHNSYNTAMAMYTNTAMAVYTLSTWQLIQALSNETANDEVKQVWYVDDSPAVGSLAGIKNGENIYRPRDQTLAITQNLQRPSS